MNISISIAERKIALNFLIKKKKILERDLKNNLVVDGKNNCNNVDEYNAIITILKAEGADCGEDN